MTLLIAGGAEDPNVETLVAAARRTGLAHELAVTSSSSSPVITWNLQTDELTIAGKPTRPRAAFIRPDVFSPLMSPTAATAHRVAAWSSTLAGWALAHREVRVLNRRALTTSNNKLDVLVRARRCGLAIPETWATNDPALVRSLRDDTIAKPVNGGAMTLSTEEALRDLTVRDGAFGAPAIVQRRLAYPEARVYVVGSQLTAFRLRSKLLDYRASPDVDIEHWKTFEADVEPIAKAFRQLAHELALDLAAGDFKTDPRTGGLVFLEINSMPMFGRFDFECGGVISRHLLEWLTADGPGSAAVVSQPPGAVLTRQCAMERLPS